MNESLRKLAAIEMMEFDSSMWLKWAAPGIGILAAGLVLVCSRWLLTARRQAAAPTLPRPPQAPPATGPLEDPFLHGSNSERRKSIRRGGAVVAILISDAEAQAEPFPGWVLDRSTGGLRIAVSQDVTVGTILSVRPANAEHGFPWIQVEVTNCQGDQQTWEFGCRFVRTPAWNYLLFFG